MEAAIEKPLGHDIDAIFRKWRDARDAEAREAIDEWALDHLSGREYADFKQRLAAWKVAAAGAEVIRDHAAPSAAAPGFKRREFGPEVGGKGKVARREGALDEVSEVVLVPEPTLEQKVIKPPLEPEPSNASRSTPRNTASAVLAKQSVEGVSRLRFHREKFWWWDGGAYLPQDEDTVRKLVGDHLNKAFCRTADGGKVSFNPKKNDINEVLDALRIEAHLQSEYVPPCWLPSGEPAGDFIVCRNNIVNVHTLEAQPHTHTLWTHDVLGFDWDPNAPCPTWTATLKSMFPDEQDAQDLLEAWIGYCMTLDTWAHKGMLHLGVTRSGKSTIQRLIEKLVGPRGWVALALDKWLVNEFSAHGLIGKRCAFFPDVRLKEGRMYGQNYDPGGMDHKSVQMLLRITGEDSVSLRKMHGMDLIFEGVLPLKVNMTSNVVPNFNDEILPNRFLKLHYRVNQETAGKMDPFLGQKLERELSGIAARCLAAYAQVRQGGGFKQARCGLELDRALMRAREPRIAMIAECLEPTKDPAEYVVKGDALRACRAWLKENGHSVMASLLRDEDMGSHIIPRFDHFRGLSPRECWKQTTDGKRRWAGLRLTAEGLRLAERIGAG